jgi:hypothetical protein
MKAAKQHLLLRAIATASPPDQPKDRPGRSAIAGRQPPPPPSSKLSSSSSSSSSLPEPLLDLLLILPCLLDPAGAAVAPLSQESLDILLSNPPLSDLEALLPDLSSLVSSHLRASALDLARIASPSTNPSYLHRHIPALATSLATLADRDAEVQRDVTSARLETLASLASLLSDYDAVLASLIRSLEAKHGAIARSVELDAASISLQAQRVHLDGQSTLHSLRKDIYSPEAVVALKNYASHLKDARTRTEERLRGLAAELGEYGVGVAGGEEKEKLMKEMARVYRDMGKQMKDAQGDLDRLRRG